MAAPPGAIVIGSGFGGLGAAIRLKEAGVTDLVVLERAGEIGGTWRDNTYPGAACDIPAHLYSFSFELKPDWSTVYPRQPEIRDYLEHCADAYGLRRHLRFGAEVTRADFDGDRAVWTVSTRDGRSFEAPVLVAAPGPLSDPRIPDISGRARFGGAQFHTARWDHDVELTDMRVGVVGTGASGIQVVPEIVDEVAHLTVLQRSAPWIIPRLDREYSRATKKAFAHVPGLQRLYRWLVYWQKELRVTGFDADSRAMDLMQRYALWNMRRHVADPRLREALTPEYAMGCKRILISSEYYPALTRDHTSVETTPIAAVTEDGLRLEDDRELDLDVIVWATGFRVDEPLGDITFTGLGGRDLEEVWSPHPRAHLGTTVPGFPNLFFVLGPNTGLGHNSMIFMMESQYDYIVDAVRRLTDRDIAYLDVREEALRSFTAEVEERTREMVWSSGCRSWYVDDDGYNFTLWPGWTVDYRRRTRHLDISDYHVATRAPRSSQRAASL